MYAVIASGGKQQRVAVGETIEVELLKRREGEIAELTPVLVVDGDRVIATPAELASTSVSGRVTGTALGPKIHGATYKSKTNQRRRYGHRQHYHTVEITEIQTSVTAPAADPA
jgi:large subunit ribosomal protein L21